MDKGRKCITTRGCVAMSNCNTTHTLNRHINGIHITSTCCEAKKFSNDDIIPIDYNDVCNSAFSPVKYSNYILVLIGLISILISI